MKSTKHLIITGLCLFSLIIALFVIINSYFSGKYNESLYAANIVGPSSERDIKLPEYKSSSNGKSGGIISHVSSSCLPSRFNFFWEVYKSGKISKSADFGYDISFPDYSEYSDIDGVTCFRGNNYRNSASFGIADVTSQKLEKLWNIRIGSIDKWTGVGWTGQPSIIKWNDDIKQKMNLFPNKKNKNDLKEVIYATLDGKIYFLDMDNGEYTRSPINVGYSHKGSISVDPRGYPLLYAGQGIEEVGGKRVEIGFRIFSLLDQKLLYFINGFDPFALRAWAAFDSNAVVDKRTDTLIECSENGILYAAKLNTKFNQDKGTISISPDLAKYRYRSPKNGTIGMENSVAIYKNYAYFTDNSGTLQCVDLNTLTPVWIRDVTDDSDSTIALDEENDTSVSLYTGCEVDKQKNGGSAYIRKINALTGELLWEKSYKCAYNSDVNGGVLASPVIGKNDISDLVIFNIAKTDNTNKGKLIAFNKNTGKEVWVLNLDNYGWSSPVDVYTKDGKSYIIVCDSVGNMMLVEGKTGKICDKINLGANIEGSPAVYENTIIVGTRGQQIYGVKIK